MKNTFFFILLGYVSGSVLYAKIFGHWFGGRDIYRDSPDQNPGSANAFHYGGFWCGTLTLFGDLLKGFLPVALYMASKQKSGVGLSLVLAAPVVGHIFPVFSRFSGGKGIATTFGCLLGLFPYGHPVFLFSAVFVFLSVCVRITPHYYRTIAAYLLTAACMLLAGIRMAITGGFLLMTGTVCLRLLMSKEEKGKIEVRLLWRH